MGCGAVICALPIPWFSEKKDFYFVGLLLWGVLFFGGFILPPVTGIMINSVPDSQKASANSIANLCYNLLGYLPAPLIYGFIATFTEVKGP
jgi:MFS family permease